jgi:hypothetical protein
MSSSVEYCPKRRTMTIQSHKNSSKHIPAPLTSPTMSQASIDENSLPVTNRPKSVMTKNQTEQLDSGLV